MDLNIIVECDEQRDDAETLAQKLARCMMLGYHTVALSVVVDAKTNNKPTIPPPPEVKSLGSKKFNVLTRLTVKVAETIQIYNLTKNQVVKKYDLLALEPQNAKILQYISTGGAECDILTFDLTQRLDYSIFKIKYKVLEDRGVCTEINYGAAQLGAALRRNILSNGQNLVEKTTKNIILSSGINDTFRLRGPKDVKSLGVLFLMPVNKCHDAVYNNGVKAVNLSKYRANPASSAIELVVD